MSEYDDIDPADTVDLDRERQVPNTSGNRRWVRHLATYPDGSQLEVVVFPSFAAAATRPDCWSAWGPPVELVEQ